MLFWSSLSHLVWRTLCAFVPFLAKPDDAFAKRQLSAKAYSLYLSMDKRDRSHACQVASALLKELKDPAEVLLSAAFLHDLGKADAGYNAFERILVHLYCPRDLPKEPRLKGLWGGWQRRLHHAYYGAEKIRAAGLEELLAVIVEKHHQPEGQPLAEILKRIEDRF